MSTLLLLLVHSDDILMMSVPMTVIMGVCVPVIMSVPVIMTVTIMLLFERREVGLGAPLARSVEHLHRRAVRVPVLIIVISVGVAVVMVAMVMVSVVVVAVVMVAVSMSVVTVGMAVSRG